MDIQNEEMQQSFSQLAVSNIPRKNFVTLCKKNLTGFNVFRRNIQGIMSFVTLNIFNG